MSKEEQILVIPAALAMDAIKAASIRLSGSLPESTDGFFPSDDSLLPILQENATFVPRQPAEDNPELKQLIVYALVTHGDKILCYKRGKVGAEARLHAKHSVGIGGHINPEDWDLGATGAQAFNTALARELQEEVGILGSHIAGVRLLGLVNEDGTDVGRVHLGLVYEVGLAGIAGLKFEEALVEPQWLSMAELKASEELELWSSLVVEAVQHRPGYQVRVIEEKDDLDDRLDRLNAFLDSPQFDDVDPAERERMLKQRNCMAELSAILGERIDAFQ
jgi:predicted NUDIX family phosphoesterase